MTVSQLKTIIDNIIASDAAASTYLVKIAMAGTQLLYDMSKYSITKMYYQDIDYDSVILGYDTSSPSATYTLGELRIALNNSADGLNIFAYSCARQLQLVTQLTKLTMVDNTNVQATPVFVINFDFA